MDLKVVSFQELILSQNNSLNRSILSKLEGDEIQLLSLHEQLLELKEKISKKTPEGFMKTTADEVQKLIESRAIEGLSLGTKAPQFSLPDSQGNQVSLYETLQKGPLVLSFYRGSW